MIDKSPKEALKVALDKRILNEFGSKILNEERLEKVIDARRSTHLDSHSNMEFGCECDDHACQETISMSTEEYTRIHHKTKYFVVVPSHVRVDLEEIVNSFSNYSLVAKYFPRSRTT